MSKHGSEAKHEAGRQPPRSESASGGGRPASVDLAELTLAVYVEELALHKRVLFVGDPTSAAPERLARGARSVEVVSTRSRVRGTRRGGRVASRRWPTQEDEGLWDVILIPDLPAAGLADDDRVRQVERWLAPGGVLIAGTPDPEGPAAHPSALAYEAFFDLLDGSFEHVRMLGQAPFSAFSLVDFAPAGELGVTFDGSILEGAGERAQRYYAVCGDRDVVLDAYAVVQVPTAAVGAPPVREPEVRARDDRGAARLSELSERLREQQDALDAANVHAEEIERELESARGELEEARADLASAHDRADAAQGERDGLSAELQRARSELRGAVERADEARRALDARERELEAAREGGDESEYVALEASLHERGRELTALRAEVERRGTLVRDLIEELRETREAGRIGGMAEAPVPPAPAPAPVSTPVSSDVHAELDGAVARAVAAEAEKAELAFRLDEVRGELAVAQQRGAHDLEGLERAEAGLEGTVRGLRARVAELTERQQQLQARLTLAEDDRAAAEARNRRLVRELAEAREQVELEIARARTTEAAQADSPVDPDEIARLRRLEQRASEREAKLASELEQCRAELAERSGSAPDVEGMRAGYEARVRELVGELHAKSGEAERALVQAGALRERVATAERAEAELRGELAGTALRLNDREQAVESLHAAALERASRVVVAGRREAGSRVDALPSEDLSAELARVQQEATSLREELERARRAPATVEYARDTGVEDRASSLAAMVGARDALIARLQRQLAETLERRRTLEARIDACAADLSRSREELESARAIADVRGLESGREVNELAARLEQRERERNEALDALQQARAILTQLAGDLPERPETADDGASTWHLRERIARLDAEAADREVLLRSLTAQLQERDDRIRALERLQDGGPPDDESLLRQRLFEMEERVARLQDELEHERTRGA